MAAILFTDIQELLTLSGAAKKSACHIKEDDLSIFRDAAMVVDKGVICWAGEKKNLKVALKDLKLPIARMKKISLKNKCVMPAFVEAHTHLIHAGDRKNEFELRNQGLSYQDIAAQGGGIQSTVRATVKASEKELLDEACSRAQNFLSQGVTTLEIKSGYGLSEKNEIKILSVASALAKKLKSMRIVKTYLGPHALPEGRTGGEYINEIIDSTLPKIKKMQLAERVDMFIEEGYYSIEHAQKYFEAAQKLGFGITAHAEQLSRLGSATWLAKANTKGVVQSLDHVVQIDESDIAVIAKSKTTCVLLPTSDFYLKIKYPPARRLIDSGARVALATDYNPGTSPTCDLSFVGVLARLQMKMSLSEVIVAYTLGAAHALGLSDHLGSLEKGKAADFIVLEDSWRDLFYQVGHHRVSAVFKSGINAYKS
jgi:imidazolonepropionase